MLFPVAHIGGAIYQITCLAAGFPMLVLEAFDPAVVIEQFGKHKVTSTGGAPAMYAGLMAICLFSLAGIPPMVGFQAKLSVLQALISTGLPSYIGLAVFAVMMSLVGAFYYLRVIKVMYFDEPLSTVPIQAPFDMRAVLSVNGALLLILGIVPGSLMALCAKAIVQMLAT